MRFVIHGAGGVGGTIGGRLAQAGHDVVLIARGAHGAALRDRGLRLVSPDSDATLRLAVVEHPRELVFAGDEVVILAVKSQDTVVALDALAAAAPPSVTIACAQNGIANEREALRRFADVVAVYVWMPALHLEPGIVEIGCAPSSGQLDVGRYPSGLDARVEAIGGALTAATFEAPARADVMRWKHRKLLSNLGNAIEAACGGTEDDAMRELDHRACSEGAAVLRAAGLDAISEDEDRARSRPELRPIAGRDRPGGSSWQSLARATGAIEADHLNGEIVLLGRLHGVATPVNALLQRIANELARERRPAGSLTASALLARL